MGEGPSPQKDPHHHLSQDSPCHTHLCTGNKDTLERPCNLPWEHIRVLMKVKVDKILILPSEETPSDSTELKAAIEWFSI